MHAYRLLSTLDEESIEAQAESNSREDRIVSNSRAATETARADGFALRGRKQALELLI